ncbi:cyclin G [Euwallacea fornicatus]|uniref:cyclin G n=1 Tax=Euwallacea fornicatus TaxID=995702 RepID=UPI0033901D7A
MDKRRGWPVPDAVISKPLSFDLEEFLQDENSFRPNLSAISENDIKHGEVNIMLRDGAVCVLRFLRVWLDLPHSVFFYSVSYLDMFLVKMKVQDKFLRCLTLSCLHIAIEQESHNVDVARLVKVSQSKCTSCDVLRMADIVKKKIQIKEDKNPITPVDFLDIYIKFFINVTNHWEHIVRKGLNQIKERMYILLEVLLADSNTAYFQSSTIALIVFQNEAEKIMSQGLPNKSVYYLGEVLEFLSVIREIQLKCKLKNSELKSCYLQVSKVLKQYDGEKKNNFRRRHNWNFPMPTVQMSAKRFSYYPLFETITE